MKKLLGILVLGLLLSGNAYAKIIKLTNDVQLDVPSDFVYSKLSQNLFEEIDGWDEYFGLDTEMYYLGTENSVNFSIEILENPDEFLEPIIKKIEKKNFQSEKAAINFLGKEIKKLAKKRKYESIVFIIKGGISITELMNDNNEFKDFMVEINDMSPQELEKEMRNGNIDFLKEFNEGLGELKQFYKFNKIKLSKDNNDNPYIILNYKASVPPLKTIGQWFLFIHNDMPYFMGVDCMGCDKLKKLSLIKMVEPMLGSKKNEVSDNANLTEQLNSLNELYKSGALTKEEFTKAKEKLLN
tara:strand:+ start:668 stop:1561 length:894 start_codon:yes stop_codon:yes gene_type:complete